MGNRENEGKEAAAAAQKTPNEGSRARGVGSGGGSVPPAGPLDGDIAATWASLDDLHGWPKNPRKNEDTVWRVVLSIKRFGWGRTIGARRENGELVWGHTACAAAHQLSKEWAKATPEEKGKWHKDAIRTAVERVVPVRFGDWTPEEAHALALADNRLQEYSTWDETLLAEAVGDMSMAEAHLLGWNGAALEKMVQFNAASKLGGEGGRRSGLGDLRYQVVVDVEDEQQQGELLGRLENEGFKCKPLIL